MERMLKGLFDFQKFENNTALRNVIDSVHSRWATCELSLDNLGQINAAGTVLPTDSKNHPEK